MEELSLEQKECFDAAMSDRNVFISGAGGVGKSFLVNEIIKEFKARERNCSVTASTGVAALNVGGVTIHSFLGTAIAGNIEEAKVKLGTKAHHFAIDRLRSVHSVIVDEISMLSGDYLTMMDFWMRQLRGNNEQPFGGCQVILVGDFLQLPPVERDRKPQYRYAFNSPSWEEANFETFDLTRSFRQQDQTFINALNRIRFGDYSKEVRKVFRPCVGRELEDPTFLVSTNKEASDINGSKFMMHPGETFSAKPLFSMSENFKYVFKKNKDFWKDIKGKLSKNSLTDCPLRLKIGVPVLVLKNNRIKGYVNGQRGLVSDIQVTPNKEITSVTVEFLDGNSVSIERESWDWLDPNRSVMGTMHHFPLRLGWSITIHKSQGLTLDNVEVDLSKGFAAGQAYVALSRMKSLEGLALTDAINPGIVKADKEIIDFYDKSRIARES